MTVRYSIEADIDASSWRFVCLAPNCTRTSDWLSSADLAISIADAHWSCCHAGWSGFAEAVQRMPRST